MKPRVLISGGAGFIGSHLCDYFIDHDYRVLCVDNLLTGQKNNIHHLLSHPSFEFIRQDVTRPFSIQGKVDCILHFASPASPPDYQKYPLETLKVGSLGTLNLLELAKQQRARFVLASTSEVYGDPAVSPQKESYYGNVNSVGPRSCYDEAKRFAEALTAHYNLDGRMIRIFNTYGPRMRRNDGRVIPNFICQMLARKPLTVYGDGKQTRSFCYVTDLVRGIYQLATVDKKDLKGYTVFNLGNPGEFTLLELVKLLSGIAGRKLPVKHLPLPQDDPKQRKPDIARVKKILGWQPAIKLEDGLRKTLLYFETNC